MLPWTQPPPRPPVDKALDKYRDRRNRQLEHDVAALLTDAGYIVRERIKPSDPQRLGVPELSTEIDAVAGRPGSYTLWLLEAKDSADTVVTPEVRRHLDTFYTGHRKARPTPRSSTVNSPTCNRMQRRWPWPWAYRPPNPAPRMRSKPCSSPAARYRPPLSAPATASPP
ncbi:hypothetical protein NKG94_17170 [Micromonospora sp. M12]